jgi:carbonic anhydrase
MQKLIDGLKRFVHTVENEERELFDKLARHQAPSVLLVTCSDSRVVPHFMTQTGPGDLFVIRNAGNIIPPPGHAATGEGATVEYAMAALGVADVIVCGHSNCGAMNGLLHVDDLGPGLQTVKDWLGVCAPTKRIVDTQLGHLEGDALLDRTIELNVLAQLDNLRCHPSVAARVHQGDVRLHGWVYDIPSGHVRAFDGERGDFRVINHDPQRERVA